MKCVVVFGVLWLVMVSNVSCVPMTILSNDLSDLSEEDDSSPLLDDDITTKGMARLSSAATCLVAGVEYTHGQQIYRPDACEFCLCLDGEMFCWWQECPPTMEGPCKNQGPFSQCPSIKVAATPKPKTVPSTSTYKSTTKRSKITKSSFLPTTLNPNEVHEVSSASNDDNDPTTYTEEDNTAETENSTELGTSTEEPKMCIVMGQEYKVGDNLPHSTGNCLECICGQGGKITCSPHQCAPAGDEIIDYRSPEPRQANDVFK